ncbi:MAG: hypothetical protein KJ077_14025 [Anaerolineae bacterium]|nr:hypothetical protein [Anaerolineae bacterium]
MKLWQLTRLSLGGIAFVILALLLPGTGLAQETVTVRLEPVGGSGVSGTAVLTAAGEGTNVELEVQGLAPGASARATMQANTCAMPSASFAALPDLQADASGMAVATGSVLFRGTDSVSLATMADGGHVLTIQTGQMVACGVIPAAASVSGPTTLPGSGGAMPWLTAAAVVALGLCVLLVGLFLRQPGQK